MLTLKFYRSKLFIILLVIGSLLLISGLAQVGGDAHNGEETESLILEDDNSNNTEPLLSMRQFAREGELKLEEYFPGIFRLRRNDEILLVADGIGRAKLSGEVIKFDPVPRFDDESEDIFIPLSLAEKFLGQDLLIDVAGIEELEKYTEEIKAKEEIEEEEEKISETIQLILEPEQKEISFGENLKIEIVLANRTSSDRNFVFNTGQKYDLRLIDEEGETAYKWSQGQVFTQAREELNISAGKEKVWQVQLNTTRLQRGEYKLEGWLTDRRESLKTEPVEILIK